MIKIILVLVSMLHLAVCFGMESSVVENQVYLSTEAVVAAKANLNLGQMLLTGEGCEKDYGKAREYFERASEQSDDLEVQANAYFHLGKIYYFGQGVEKDDQKMREYLQKLCEIANRIYELLCSEFDVVIETGMLGSRRRRSKSYQEKLADVNERYPSKLNTMQDIAMCLLNYNNFPKDLTPLDVFAICGEKEEIEICFAQGAAIEVKSDDGSTPLHYAAINGHREVVELLIAKGADSEAKSENLLTPLFLAVINGHREVVETLIAQGVDIEAKSEDGETPLLFAAMACQREVVELLLEKGADTLVRDYKGNTALKWVLRGGSDLICRDIKGKKLTLKARAELGLLFFKRVHVHGIEVMYWAVENGHKEIVELLLSNGFESEAKDDEGCTPLHRAARYGHREVVELLLSYFPSVNVLDNYGCTPLQWAAIYGHEVVVGLLLKRGALVHLASKDGRTALHKAAEWGYPKVVTLLLAARADANAQDNSGEMPLHLAAAHIYNRTVIASLNRDLVWLESPDHKYVVKLLLAKLPSENVDKERTCAKANLCMGEMLLKGDGCMRDYERALNYLECAARQTYDLKTSAWACLYLAKMYYFELGVEKNEAKMRGYIELSRQLALMHGLDEIVMGAKILLNQKIDAFGYCNHTTCLKASGWTPLHSAALMEYSMVAELLITQRAEVNAKAADNVGTPLHVAVNHNKKKLIALLLASGAESYAIDDALGTAILNGYYEIIEVILRNGASVNAVINDGGGTLLHDAALIGRGFEGIAKVLFEHGVDPNTMDEYGRSPLHLAVENKHGLSVRTLLGYKANINALDNTDSTPLHLAVYYFDEKIVELLLAKGALYNEIDEDGYTPLHYAAMNCHRKVVELLLAKGADTTIKDKNGKTAFDLAESEDIKSLLRKVE